jgi:hypothetical protein
MSRILKPDVWYKIFTLVNRHEQIFLDRDAVELFNRTLLETGERFPCEVRCLVIQADSVSFYIKPVDGLELPEIVPRVCAPFSASFGAASLRFPRLAKPRAGRGCVISRQD